MWKTYWRVTKGVPRHSKVPSRAFTFRCCGIHRCCGVKLRPAWYPMVKWYSFWWKSIFPRICFRDLKFRIWGLEINHLKAHNFVWQGCFFFHYYLAILTTDWAQIFTGLLFYVCWDTPSEKTGLWQLPIVSTAFKRAEWTCPFSFCIIHIIYTLENSSGKSMWNFWRGTYKPRPGATKEKIRKRISNNGRLFRVLINGLLLPMVAGDFAQETNIWYF